MLRVILNYTIGGEGRGDKEILFPISNVPFLDMGFIIEAFTTKLTKGSLLKSFISLPTKV